MTNRFSRRFFLGSALSGLAGAGWATPPAVSLRPRARPDAGKAHAVPGADALVADAKLGGRVGFSVMDVKTGLVLEGRDARKGQPPASVTKAVTALYGLAVLGAEYRFGTRLLATGVVKNGVLNGDLVLAGGGDPTLDTDALADMAARLKKAGVHSVKGRFLVYGGALPYVHEINSGQPAHVGYNPSVSGLSLNYNRVHFEWKRNGSGYHVMMDARSARYRPDVQVARMLVKERKAPIYTYRDGGSFDSWTVARAALGKGGSRWLPVRKPEFYTGEVFATFARSQGIVLRAPEVMKGAPGGTVLVTHQSAPLRDILREMLKYSTNLTAEMVGLAATSRRLGRPAISLRASAREMNSWARKELGMDSVQLVDHSGLGEASRLSPAAMAAALARVHRNGALKPILKDIPMKDGKGRPISDPPVKVVAKTGTLYFVSSLAGYMTAPDGTELAFAIFAANEKLRAGINPERDERPPGARGWNRRAKKLQQQLIERWGVVYGS